MKDLHNFKYYSTVVIFVFFIFSCKKENKVLSPTIETISVSNITPTSATCGGNISSEGGYAILSRGICWSKNTNPTIADYKTSDGKELGNYSSQMTGLSGGTTYYVRAYAQNETGVSYGGNISFVTTIVIPELTTKAVTAVTSNSAISGGIVNFDGGVPLMACGICWSTNPEPSITDNKTVDTTTIGNFKSVITSLLPNTTYYFRAYATNSEGSGYGIVSSAKTGRTVTDLDGNIYNTVQIGTQVWMVDNLKVTHFRNGDSIPNVISGYDWTSLVHWVDPAKSVGYCNYNNDPSMASKYGHIYSGFVATDLRNVCPSDWHVPTDDDWNLLINYLGNKIAADKMKVSSNEDWNSLKKANNSSGFSALPCGSRWNDGQYIDLGSAVCYWSSTFIQLPNNSNVSFHGMSLSDDSDVHLSYADNSNFFYGKYIRCIKD